MSRRERKKRWRQKKQRERASAFRALADTGPALFPDNVINRWSAGPGRAQPMGPR